MALNVQSFLPVSAPPDETSPVIDDATLRWRETISTAVATVLAILVVALIAVLMGMA